MAGKYRGKPKEASISGGQVKTRKQAEFVGALQANGGRVEDAAKAVGLAPNYGHHLVMRNAEIRAALDEIKQNGKPNEWADMRAIARDVLFTLATQAKNENVQLAAAQTIVAYDEGKPVSRTELMVERREAPRIHADEYRFVLSYMAEKRCTLAEAVEYAKKHPTEVLAWCRGTPMIEAEIVGEK